MRGELGRREDDQPRNSARDAHTSYENRVGHSMTGAEAIAAALEAAGVERIYALPGEENIDVVEALRTTSIQLIVCRHEQHAAFMAATEGRLTGRPGVCLATLGPGATNLATGLAHATLGQFPVVAITGQKRLFDNPEGSFQKVDVLAVLDPVSVDSVSATHPDELDALLGRVWVSSVARGGAAILEIPEDVAAASTPHRASIAPAVPPRTVPRDMGVVSTMINDAEFPIILAGSGAAGPANAAALAAFAERTGIGVVTTQMGSGAVPAESRQNLGALGIHDDDWIHLAFDLADLVVTIGYHPGEHPPSMWHGDQEIVEIHDIVTRDERWYRPTARLSGDIAMCLEELERTVHSRPSEKVERIAGVVSTGLASEAHDSRTIDAIQLVDVLIDTLPDDSIVALDNTVAKIWFARRYPARRTSGLLMDNALATMGAGLAIGTVAAMLLEPERTVTVVGDGGFMMNVQDLITTVTLGVSLDILILEDSRYGFIKWEQESQGNPAFGVELTNPDFVALAESFGATSAEVSTPADLREVLSTPPDGVRVVVVDFDQTANDLLGSGQRRRAHSAFNVLE